jgi:hypothetical protein
MTERSITRLIIFAGLLSGVVWSVPVQAELSGQCLRQMYYSIVTGFKLLFVFEAEYRRFSLFLLIYNRSTFHP